MCCRSSQILLPGAVGVGAETKGPFGWVFTGTAIDKLTGCELVCRGISEVVDSVFPGTLGS
jgi:hypothetical protein